MLALPYGQLKRLKVYNQVILSQVIQNDVEYFKRLVKREVRTDLLALVYVVLLRAGLAVVQQVIPSAILTTPLSAGH